MHFILSLLLFLLFPIIGNADVRFLTISDIHYGHNNVSGEDQDTDQLLLTASMKKFTQLTTQVDFMITLGDFPTHMLGRSQARENDIKTVFHELFLADQSQKPLFYVTGNNDSLGGNYQSFSWHNRSVLSLAKDWQKACIFCNGLVIDDSHMEKDGYYSTYVLPDNKDIILIALNSIQFVKRPFFSFGYPGQNKDALQQLKWLKTQLTTLHGKQLLIALHIPPGNDHHGKPYWHKQYLTEFINLLQQSESHYGQISLLSGHTHMSDFRKIYLRNGHTIYDYATPSISRIHKNNSGMLIFDLNDQLQIKDYTAYYTVNSEKWKDLKYNAIKGKNSIFPDCSNQTIANCLDNKSDEFVCKRLQENHFYGTKSERVDSSVCKYTYRVN